MNAADRKRVVIVGAGFGGLAAAKVLGSRDEGSPIAVTVIDKLNYHLFQPLLYQVAMAGLAATDVAYPIRAALHGRRNISVLLGEVTGVDITARTVRLDDGTTLPYDYLVMAAGAQTSYFGHEDWAKFAPGLKDLDDALEVRIDPASVAPQEVMELGDAYRQVVEGGRVATRAALARL